MRQKKKWEREAGLVQRCDLFRVGSSDSHRVFSSLFAWWMVPEQERTEKLQRWWQPALTRLWLMNQRDPHRVRKTDYSKSKKPLLTLGSHLGEWTCRKLWFSITLKLILDKNKIRPSVILSFSHGISYSWIWALLYRMYYQVLMQAQLPFVPGGVIVHLPIKRRAGSLWQDFFQRKTSQDDWAKILEILKPFRQWLQLHWSFREA